MFGAPFHDSFTLERDVPAPPVRVFAAYAVLEIRRTWFPPPFSVLGTGVHTLDFRVGGGEVAEGEFPGGQRFAYRSQFLDIAINERIVLASTIGLDGSPIAASLVTLQFQPTDPGTHLTHTEQYVFLKPTGEGSADRAEREGGTRLLLNGLSALLGRAMAEAPGP